MHSNEGLVLKSGRTTAKQLGNMLLIAGLRLHELGEGQALRAEQAFDPGFAGDGAGLRMFSRLRCLNYYSITADSRSPSLACVTPPLVRVAVQKYSLSFLLYLVTWACK